MKVNEIADLIHGIVAGDAERDIRAVASLESARDTDLAYVENRQSLNKAAASRAGCLLVPVNASLPARTTISVAHPKLALIHVAEALHPAPSPPPGIHPRAVVGSTHS